MKKIFTTVLVSMMTCLCMMAQMSVWSNGQIIFQKEYSQFDSITFAIPAAPEPVSLADGVYIVGAATAVSDFNDANIAKMRMGQGLIEDTYNYNYNGLIREGMYEKYVALEAGQNFEILKVESGYARRYGANLTSTQIENYISGYKGGLIASTPMQVPASGLYHAVVDFNLDGQLTSSGGAQIVLVPCEWSIRGGLNGWGCTPMQASQFNKSEMTYTLTDVVVDKDGEYKLAHGYYYWYFNLDLHGTLRCLANFGADKNGNLLIGGNNMLIERGLYDFTLTWNLEGDAVENSFSFVANKTSDIIFYPETKIVGLSGTFNGWGDPSGRTLAAYNPARSVVTDSATQAGNYVYEIKGMQFESDDHFKFRFDGSWLGLYDIVAQGVALSDDGYNITGVAGCYDIDIIYSWNGEQCTAFTVVFTPSTSCDNVYADITVSGIVPADWEHCYIWAWDSNGAIFYEWPGEELTITNGMVSRTFTNVATPLNVIFSNGAGAQTFDIVNVQDGDVISIGNYLR